MGPAAGLVLADLGADVIKIEPVGDGDKTRRLPGSGAGYFPMINRNKKSLAVDLKSAEGLDLVRKLIAGADVVTENFRGGVLDKLGLGFEELRQNNPGLVYFSMKGFSRGPTRTGLPWTKWFRRWVGRRLKPGRSSTKKRKSQTRLD
jgi:crotonobetainyl-CoA:carnitine CoA-transferase CaiB-like acyl-CoA transferase